MEGRLVAGIVPVYQKREEFDYFKLYDEESAAYCAEGHPLFSVADSAIDAETLKQHEFINHRYAIHQEKSHFAAYDSFFGGGLPGGGRGHTDQDRAFPRVSAPALCRGAGGARRNARAASRPGALQHAFQSDPAAQHGTQPFGEGFRPGAGSGSQE